MELWGRLERDRLALLVHATQAGFTEWDGETKALTYSGRFKEMLGHPREADTSGWPPFFELVHPDDRPGTLAEWRAVLQAKRSPGTQQPGAFAPLGARRRRRRVQPARAQAHAAQPAATPLRCTIVALSSNDDPITVARALASGCDYYLAKPASREALWSILAGDAPAAAAAPAAGAPPGSATPVSSTPTSPARSRRFAPRASRCSSAWRKRSRRATAPRSGGLRTRRREAARSTGSTGPRASAGRWRPGRPTHRSSALSSARARCVLTSPRWRFASRYELFSTHSPRAALPMARKVKPHLILCDVDMPGMDGGDVSAALHGDDELRHIPLLFLTAVASPEAIESLAGQLGGRPAISKFAPLEQLLSRIASLVA